MKTKIIAYYLPQFHQIKENDIWWGPGFTEWTNVKKAKPLYRNHYQPRIPLHKNYYDLSDNSVMVKQMKLAKKYNIDGFCFYHYWFHGKKLLEKPVESVLSNQAAKLPFCLMWANEPWTRTWNGDIHSKGVIMPQDYGDEKDWMEHFYYLLPFLKDKRYIRINDIPIFIIYRASSIPKCTKMLKCWRNLAKQNGLKDIYFICSQTITKNSTYIPEFQAVADFEPHATWGRFDKDCFIGYYDKLKNKLSGDIYNDFTVWNYDSIYRKLVQDRKFADKHFLGAFVDWDNSPRRESGAYIVKGATPEKFYKYLVRQLKRSNNMENEFLFLNAWNEWGEGAYLEPDEKFGYAYLNAVKRAVQLVNK